MRNKILLQFPRMNLVELLVSTRDVSIFITQLLDGAALIRLGLVSRNLWLVVMDSMD
jgi:hypothetical protein